RAAASVERAGFSAPRTQYEALVAGVWADLLRVEAVGRDDDFFRLGGHSLLAMQATARLSRAVGTDVPLRWMFESRRLAAFAERIAALGAAARTDAAAPPARGTTDGARLSFGQERLWFLAQ